MRFWFLALFIIFIIFGSSYDASAKEQMLHFDFQTGFRGRLVQIEINQQQIVVNLTTDPSLDLALSIRIPASEGVYKLKFIDVLSGRATEWEVRVRDGLYVGLIMKKDGTLQYLQQKEAFAYY